jgi:cytidylate kinase
MTAVAPVPVIAIDGPTASGKGTVARLVAQNLGWHLLDSGALYRLTALSALRRGASTDDEAQLAELARSLPVRFQGSQIFFDSEDVTDAIRAEEIGVVASRIAVLGGVRVALLERQRAYRRLPGLVADGRDMGSVVFPDARLKVFLTASVESRAERRYKQLIEKGFSANFDSLLRELQERDARDQSRANAPLVAAQGAVVIDSSLLSVLQTVSEVMDRWTAVAGSASEV